MSLNNLENNLEGYKTINMEERDISVPIEIADDILDRYNSIIIMSRLLGYTTRTVYRKTMQLNFMITFEDNNRKFDHLRLTIRCLGGKNQILESITLEYITRNEDAYNHVNGYIDIRKAYTPNIVDDIDDDLVLAKASGDLFVPLDYLVEIL